MNNDFLYDLYEFGAWCTKGEEGSPLKKSICWFGKAAAKQDLSRTSFKLLAFPILPLFIEHLDEIKYTNLISPHV